MGTNAQLDNIKQERITVDRTLRDLRSRLQVLERNRKEANDRNQNAHRYNLAITHEYTANLKVSLELNQLTVNEKILQGKHKQFSYSSNETKNLFSV